MSSLDKYGENDVFITYAVYEPWLLRGGALLTLSGAIAERSDSQTRRKWELRSCSLRSPYSSIAEE